MKQRFFRYAGIGSIVVILLIIGLCISSPAATPPAPSSIAADAKAYLSTELSNEEQVSVPQQNQRLRLPGIGEIVVKMGFFLGIVLLLMYGLLLIVQKLYGNRITPASPHTEVIRILSYKKIDVKKGIVLIDVLGKILVIGSDIDGLNLITEITDPAQVEEARRMTALKPDLFTFNPFQAMVESCNRQYRPENRTQRSARETHGLVKKIDELKNRLQT